nr:tRNA pseudouridine(38-40) synthase TruA [Eubacterium sp.]
MKRILLRVAYDGTEYSGWQVQPNAVTIEGELNKALKDLLGEEIQVIGASRTDAGVHSLGNVCVFDTQSPIPAEKMSYALNTRLPEDIRVIESREVEADFHPRHCDSVKTYEYRIWNDKFPSPTLRLYSHFSYRDIDTDKMREAAAKLVGEHDFGAFCGAGSQVETTVRTIYSIEIFEDRLEAAVGRMIRIRVTGSGFLYNMVRIIAGTLLDIGTGLMEVGDIDKCLE